RDEELPVERGCRVAAEDVAADHGVAVAVAEGVHGEGEARLAVAGAVLAGVGLEDAPAVVAALLDEILLLPDVLAHVADPEVAGHGVEGPAPGVAEAVGEDLLG